MPQLLPAPARQRFGAQRVRASRPEIWGVALLVALQFVIAWSSVRSKAISGLVKSEPALLFYRGAFLHDAMKRERVTEDEVRAAVRESSAASLEEVEAVVLETAATITVIPRSAADMRTCSRT
jgi:uncharacterized membrane protein YcaP (DUF421 family)